MSNLQQSQQRVVCPRCNWSHVPSTGPLHTGVYKSQCRHCGHSFNFKSTVLPKATVSFTINGKAYSVSEEDSQMVLNSFLTDRAGLRQTKYTCYQGGCGSCVVSATFHDPVLNKETTIAVNSCLRPVYACDGWAITTTEGLGNSQDGFHPIQERLADNNGSQCGWCSPGMVISMYSYMQNNPQASVTEIEGLFDGNICRCTGYRAILDAMKSFAPSGQICLDIEDLSLDKKKICKKTGNECSGSCHHGNQSDPVHVILRDAEWYAPTSLQGLYDILNSSVGKTVKLVMGNTSNALFRDQYDVSVDMKGVPELYNVTVTENELTLGANVTLSNMLTLLTQAADNPGYGYCRGIIKHITKVANTPVRNVGTWAGNIVMKKMHPTFPSDIFIILETLNASINIGTAATGGMVTVTPNDFLQLDLTGKVILSVTFPKVSSSDYIQTFKIMPKSQNCLAYTNVGIFLTLDVNNNCLVQGSPRIVFGGISATQFHATNTEGFLVGKFIGTNQGLQDALRYLEAEMKAITADTDPVLASEDYRKDLVTSLFYRYTLNILGDTAGPRFKSGATEIERPLSKASQDFSTVPSEYPLTEPMAKVAAKKQAAGEAEYINGIPSPPDMLYAQFVLSTQANCTIASIDPSAALAYPGVVTFLSASDIPGGNNFMPPFQNTPEELFCSGEVLYAGQAIGLIVAESQGAAIVASNMVSITYTDEKTPILSIQDAIDAGSFFPDAKPPDLVIGDAESAIANSSHQILGEITIPDQYHFHMENQIALCVPSETGLEVFASTQWPDMVQQAIAYVTDTTNNSVQVKVRRLGGGFGAKISRNCAVAAGCGLAAQITRRPVKLAMTLGANMSMLGKRFPYLAKYKAGVDNDGKLNGIQIDYYGDAGCQANDNPIGGVIAWADNVYKCANWHLSAQMCKTNKPANTWCRSPGSLPAICITEVMMEHVAKQLNKDPLEVKKINLYQQNDISITGTPLPYCNITDMVNQLETSAQIQQRQTDVNNFNQANRWKKQGLGIVPIKFGISWALFPYTALVSIYNGDGTVSITHGGIELGQGIHTKVIQVCASKLGIPMSKINVVPTETVGTANAQSTGGSITSELCAYGVTKCCEALLERIDPIRATMPPTATWEEVIAKCYREGVDTCARYWSVPGLEQQHPWQYFCYGVGCAEVELDVLTGNRQVNRVDILYDCGKSINPEIDIGQIEGAFIMGLGYYFSEHSKYDTASGVNLTNSIWEYHVPSSQDIPVDFRVDLLKNAFNPLGILGTKAVAEPPQCISCAVLIGLKHALEAARIDTHLPLPEHFQLDAPATVDLTQPLCLNSIDMYKLF